MKEGGRYQLWPQILILGLSLTIGLIYLTLSVTWNWFNEWPPLGSHWNAGLSAAIGLISGDLSSWSQYKAYLLHNDLSDDLFFHVLSSVTFSSIVGFMFSFCLLYVAGGRDPDIHIQGPRLFVGGEAIKHAKSQLNLELRRDHVTKGVKIHPKLCITKQRELGNIFVFGQQGSGKSVVLKPLIKNIIDSGDRVLIYDQKGEYTSLFYSKAAVLINPTDGRSLAWNPARDVANAEQATLLAECLISERGGEDQFWISGARLILSGCIVSCIEHAQSWGWAELKAVLDQPETELRETLTASYPAAAKLVQKDSKTTQGFMTILSTQLSWIEVLLKAWPDSNASSFSIADWIKGSQNEQILIIPSDPLYSSASGPLCNALVSLATQHLLALPDSHKRTIWFALDELGNLPKCPALVRLLTLGRSKGARTIAGIQSLSQLHTIYGRSVSETLLSLFSNVISLRLGIAGESALKASASFGNRLVLRRSTSFDHRGNQSTSYQQLQVPVVLPEQITQLPQAGSKGVQGLLSISGWGSVYQLFWPIPKLIECGPEHVPAAWLSQTAGRTIPRRRGRRGRKRGTEQC